MTPRQLSRLLQSEHASKPWAQIKQEHPLWAPIPAGTLSLIAKRDGHYIPRKWAAMLGVKLSRKRTPSQDRRPWADRSPAELLAAFANRVEM